MIKCGALDNATLRRRSNVGQLRLTTLLTRLINLLILLQVSGIAELRNINKCAVNNFV